MSDAAGVLKMTNKSFQMIRTNQTTLQVRKKKNHHRILFKVHRCLSFKIPVEKTVVDVPDVTGLAYLLTPDVRVVHTRLVIGQSDEGCV